MSGPIDHLPVLVVAVPLVGALVSVVVAVRWRRAGRAWAILALLGTLAASGGLLWRILAGDAGAWAAKDALSYHLGGWPPPWGIELRVDALAAGMSLLISTLAVATAVASGPVLRKDGSFDSRWFPPLLLLLVAGLQGIVCTGDAFNLFVFLEISSLAAYGLIAAGGDRGAVGAFRYLIVGTVAASFYLLGVGFLYGLTGTLNLFDLHRIVAGPGPALPPNAVLCAVSLIGVGLAIKTAIFPLHGWLPDAYGYAPPVVATFVAAVMTKVGAYAIIRIFFWALPGLDATGLVLDVLGWAAALGVIVGSIMAVAQRDVVRMLAYSSVAQMGLIGVGMAIGNDEALVGTLLHILNHAVMKGGLFLCVATVVWRTGHRRIDELEGLLDRMPLTTGAIVLLGLSMVGIPPTAGFFSKWYLVLGAVRAGSWVDVAVVAGSGALTALYFFRLFEVTCLTGVSGDRVRTEPVFREAPPAILAPALLFAGGVLVLGLSNVWIVERVIGVAVTGRP